MNLEPKNQLKLFGFNDEFNKLKSLYEKKKLPTKIMFSGQKGLGKSTLAYHLINYILSKDEKEFYNVLNFTINENNKSYKLIQNNTNPNFDLVDLQPEKKNIDIKQIRDLILKMNKSSFNSKPRFILIDNIEFLNLNSSNALLKNLEEPNENIYLILINSEKKILETIKSRCLNFKISKSYAQIQKITNLLIDQNISNLVNKELLNYYLTPGKILNLIKFSNDYDINLQTKNINDFLRLIIDNSYYKKDLSIKLLVYDLIEFFLINYTKFTKYQYYNYFIKKINDIKKFNLDEESFFIEFRSKLLNG